MMQSIILQLTAFLMLLTHCVMLAVYAIWATPIVFRLFLIFASGVLLASYAMRYCGKDDPYRTSGFIWTGLGFAAILLSAFLFYHRLPSFQDRMTDAAWDHYYYYQAVNHITIASTQKAAGEFAIAERYAILAFVYAQRSHDPSRISRDANLYLLIEESGKRLGIKPEFGDQ